MNASVVRAHQDWEMKTLNPTMLFMSIQVHLLQFRHFNVLAVLTTLVFRRYLFPGHSWWSAHPQMSKASSALWLKVGLSLKCPLETLKKRNPHEFWKKTWMHPEWLAFSAWGHQGLQITTLSHYLRYHNSCIASNCRLEWVDYKALLEDTNLNSNTINWLPKHLGSFLFY